MTQTATPVELREGDVFRFQYSEETRQRWRTDPNWCFDGQLIVRDGKLCDTYWGFKAGDARIVTQGEGELSFVCNINDVEKIGEYDFPLYADGDAFDLCHQHRCYKFFVKRKGAKKSPALMAAAVHKKVRDAHEAVARAARDLDWAVRQEARLLPLIDAGEEPSI